MQRERRLVCTKIIVQYTNKYRGYGILETLGAASNMSVEYASV